jgi:hypothetical protein
LYPHAAALASDLILLLQCLFQRSVGDGESIAQQRLSQLHDELCLVIDSGDVLRIHDLDLVSAYYEQDAYRHGEDDSSHGYVMNLMLLRGRMN